ncbi:PREDICTED: uncharacterized protein LOC109481804 [Branchiostoma belcheri]|uniref:Uncharacterized protein LOC109481804 n=1 Tax=Branchiostoma belcheri TaxID=7741 RepID=A0A6P5A9D4_BRABE|nr:PREDICTED: uncharacterized protein LOC109481804 [Branchiostoma belcheri]
MIMMTPGSPSLIPGVRTDRFYGIRLADGANQFEGRVEIFVNGQWGTVCDDAWGLSDAIVACRQLGFGPPVDYRRYFGQGTGPIWLDDVSCSGNEATLLACRSRGIGSHNCGHYEDVGIECGYGYGRRRTASLNFVQGDHWGNIRVQATDMEVSKGVPSSVLQYVTISGAGVLHGIEVPAIQTIGNVIMLQYVNVYNCSSHGIELVSPSKSTNYNTVKVNMTTSNTAMNLVEYNKDVVLDNIEAMGGKYGIQFKSLWDYSVATPYLDTTSATFLEICDKTSTASLASKMIIFHRSSYLYGFARTIDCSVIIKAPRNHRIHLKVDISAVGSGNGRLNLYDGSSGNQISSYYYVRTDEHTSSSDTVRMVMTGYISFTCQATVVSANRTARVNHVVANSFIQGNSEAGLVYTEQGTASTRSRIVNTVIKDNSGDSSSNPPASVSIRAKDALIEMLNNTVQNNNGGIGVRLDGPESSNTDLEETKVHKIINNTFSQNSGSDVLSFELLSEETDHLILQGNTAENNEVSATGRGIVTLTGVHTELTQNTFGENKGEHVFKCQDRENGDGQRNISIRENVFEDTVEVDRILDISGTSTRVIAEENWFQDNEATLMRVRVSDGHVQILENSFHGNSDGLLLFEHSSTSLVDMIGNEFRNNTRASNPLIDLRNDNIYIVMKNTLTNNSAPVMFRVSTTFLHDNSSTTTNVSMIGNILKDNIYDNMTSGNIVGSSCTILFAADQNVPNFHKNTLQNDEFQWELCMDTSIASLENVQDATENWWGSQNEDDIRLRIFDFDDRNDRRIVNFSPYRTSEYGSISIHADVSRDASSSILHGRIYKSLTLESSKSPYIATGDVTILPNVTLNIEPGVEIRFHEDVGILVLGSLLARGTSENKIRFLPFDKAASSPVVTTWTRNHRIRLVGGSQPWQGRLEVFLRGQWGTVCRYWSNHWTWQNSQVVCRELGYGPPTGFNTWQYGQGEGPIWLGEVQCQGDERRLLECNSQEIGVTRCYRHSWDIGITCQASNPEDENDEMSLKSWGNIRISVSKSEATVDQEITLENVDILHAGRLHRIDVPSLQIIGVDSDISDVTIANCVSDATEVVSASHTKINQLFVHNCKTAVSLAEMSGETYIGSSTMISNDVGISMTEALTYRDVYIPKGHVSSFGFVDICDHQNVIEVQTRVKLYHNSYYFTRASCFKVVRTKPEFLLLAKLSSQDVPQTVSIYDGEVPSREKRIVHLTRSAATQSMRRKEVFSVSNKMLILVNDPIDVLVEVYAIRKSESCSFEDLSCTWTNSRDTACREEDIEQEWRLRTLGVDHQWFSGPSADKTYETAYYSLGCWRDESNRAIPSLEGSDSRLDGYYRYRGNPIQKCHDVAVSRGFKVFALHHSGECLSGPDAESTYMMYGRSTRCSSNGEGGYRANHVYKIVNGQYLYAGSHYVGHPQYQIHATLENAAEPDSTLCGLSFYYFLGSDSSNHPVSLSVTTGNRSDYNRSDIFSVTAIRSSDWQLATIAIDESQNVSSVAIVARYWKGQRTSVSMDELRTFYCRQSIPSTVITETVVENNKEGGIVYKGEDGDLNVENCKIVDNGMETVDTAESTHAVSLTLMKTSLTFKNNYVAHNQKGGVNVNILAGTNWLTKSRTVNHLLFNNFISYNNQSEALVIRGNDDDDDDDLSVQLRGNTISHNCPEDTKSVLNIENAGGRVYRNTLYNNTGLHAVKWTKTVSNETSVFHGNRVLYNSGQSPSARISVVTSSGINYHSNRFVNPANSFEMGSTDRTQTSSVINATMNWWGSADQEVIRRRIRDDDVQPGLTDIFFIPFLTNLPLVTSIGGCPSDWYASTFGCYMFVVGSLDWQEAQQVCIANGAQVATFASLEEVSDVVTNLIFEAGDRGEVQKIWIGRGGLPAVVTEAPGPNEELLTVTIDDPQEVSPDIGRQSSTVVVLISDIPNKSTVTIETAVAETQSRRNPFICKKELVVRCPFACFHRGQCVGRTCICNKGWEGEACAEFHCRDVNNCGAFGTCVGPNNCRCKFGWQGRACSVSYCNRFDTCRACARETGCGWCDSSQQCLPGTGSGPDTASCPAWFYYGCLSAGATETCSGQIQKIDCEGRQCNESLASSSIATCSKCLDSQYCYYQPDALGCHGWNETRCPHGEVSPDYGDTSRINRVQWRDNVRPIDPNVTTLFLCQVTLAEEYGEQAVLIVAPTPLDFAVGNVIISGQAGGIMHRVQDIGLAGAYAFVVGIPAALEEAVAYSDFRQNVELRSIEDSVTVEDIPDEDLLTSALNGSLAVNVTIKNIPEGVAVYKCVGNVHNTNEEDDEWKSEFLVMNSSQYSELRVGDFIASTETSGWMETVQDVTESPTLLFVTTTLARCGDDVPRKPRLSTFNTTEEVYLGPDTSCIGGDNNPALLIYDNTSRDNFEVGNTIIGRPSGPVLSKIISLTDSEGLVYVEVRAVSTVDDFSSESDGDNTTTSRKRRATIGDAIRGATVNVARRTNVERSGSGTLKVTPYVTLDQGLELSLEVGLDYPFVQSASVRLFGSASIGLEIRFDFEGSATVSWPKNQNKPYRKGVAKRKFCIPVTPLFCLPGRILYEVYVSVVATASVKGFVSVDFGMSGSAAMGATWRHSGGVTLERDLQLQPPRPTYDGKLEEATASITGTLTPKLIVQIPSPALPINIPRWIRRFLPRSIQRLLTPGQSTGRSVVSVIVATVDLPVVAEVSAEACSNSCPVPEEPLKLAARVGVGEVGAQLNIGFENFNFDTGRLSASLPFIATPSKCISQEPPCCICDDGKPGKQDPETDECLCECFCDPPDNTVMGLKPKSGGECDCERCPDNSLKRKTGDIECPCTCDDGQEREMEEDGSCPCECECADGSTDTIAADGSCPCRCTCKDCSESVLGPDGCICPNDNCPICPDGSEPISVNCECQCEEPDPDCGEPPACAVGRKGPGCGQPDCEPCQGCSGNGVCSPVGQSCASSCRCSPQWMGTCCDIRRPRRAGGDPHMETVDGTTYDYYGIGEFWDCKSRVNDFGIQVRYFLYERASFTGAAAIKAGENVVTVTTPTYGAAQDLPTVRLDGIALSLSDSNQYRLGNGSVLMDIQRPEVNLTTGGGVLLLSFQYSSGLTVTLDVQYAKAVGRQFINVLYTPTVAFLRATEGLCGFMDDNVENDFCGPDGTIYSDPVLFAESWRISKSHDAGGLYGSWSWNISNFHASDVMDSSYTDPTHVPIYSIDGLPKEQILLATKLCEGLGISGNLLAGCIYDVSVTNDSTLLEQESLKTGKAAIKNSDVSPFKIKY